MITGRDTHSRDPACFSIEATSNLQDGGNHYSRDGPEQAFLPACMGN